MSFRLDSAFQRNDDLPPTCKKRISVTLLLCRTHVMISSSKRANVTLQFAPFGDGLVSFDLPQVPFPSVTPHAVKHSSPPSGTGLTPIRYTPELRMNPFAVQSAVRACGMSASRPGNHERAHPSHWLVSMPYSRRHSMPRQPENLVPAPPRWTEKHQPLHAFLPIKCKFYNYYASTFCRPSRNG